MKSLFFALCLVVNSAMASNYYFSDISGDDTRTATQAQNPSTPWKSIAKLNSIFSTLLPGDNIFFKAGETFYGNIIIGKSGTPGQRIVLNSYGSGPQPEIKGCLPVASWVSVGANLWESATAASSVSYCNIVSINGNNYAMGRTPDAGYWSIPSTNGTTTITDAAHLNATVVSAGADVVCRELMYQLNKHKITNVTGNTITFDAGSLTIPAGWGYFIQNDVKACN
ncbi:MAG: hypothetical protein JST02_13865, partial [Bacteroidetes bacterium]|nr:hypothetical protein [Bacteroidota bacterium]